MTDALPEDISPLTSTHLIDVVSGKKLAATPEEIQAVQPFAHQLLEDYDETLDYDFIMLNG